MYFILPIVVASLLFYLLSLQVLHSAYFHCKSFIQPIVIASPSFCLFSLQVLHSAYYHCKSFILPIFIASPSFCLLSSCLLSLQVLHSAYCSTLTRSCQGTRRGGGGAEGRWPHPVLLFVANFMLLYRAEGYGVCRGRGIYIRVGTAIHRIALS